MSARDHLDALEHLVSMDGWALLVAEMRERNESRIREVMAGDLDHERYLQATAECAAVDGLLAWPHQQIETLRAQLDREDS